MPGQRRRSVPRPSVDRPPLGQHFLRDRSVLAREIAYAELQGHETVLEIGPGPGILTEALLGAAGRVIAVEKDPRFRPPLEGLGRRFPHLELIWGDALEVALPRFDKVVANLPFGAALPLTFRLLEQRFDRAVLIYQHRLAERLCAGPGEPGYCRLGIAIGRRAETELLEVVRPEAFVPPPAVDSAVVLLRRVRPRFSVPDEEFFRFVLEGLFAHRDEPLGRALAELAAVGLSRAMLDQTVTRLPRRQLETPVFRIGPRDFGAICRLLWESGARITVTADKSAKRTGRGRRPRRSRPS